MTFSGLPINVSFTVLASPVDLRAWAMRCFASSHVIAGAVGEGDVGDRFFRFFFGLRLFGKIALRSSLVVPCLTR